MQRECRLMFCGCFYFGNSRLKINSSSLHNRKEREEEWGRKIYRFFDLGFFLVIVVLSVVFFSKRIKQWKSEDSVTERQNLSVCLQECMHRKRT